jgi:integrase
VGKGTGEGKPRQVVLTAEAQTYFLELTAGRAAGELIFQRDKVERRKRTEVGLAWGHGDQSRSMDAACIEAGLYDESPVLDGKGNVMKDENGVEIKIKVPNCSFHELRHSYASMLVNNGVPLAFVAAQLGHSDTRMVEKHYGHLAPNALAESIRTLAPLLGITDGTKVAALALVHRETPAHMDAILAKA